MSQASRYQVVYLACVSNPCLPKCKPSMWHRHLMVPVTVFQMGTGQCWANSWNLQKTWLSSEASFPSCEAPPPIISTMQNEGRTIVKPLERAQGTHCFRVGCQLAKRKENNRKAMQQGWKSSKDRNNTGLQYSLWAEWIRGDFFFPLCTKFWLLTESRKIFKRELYFQQEETEITWKK